MLKKDSFDRVVKALQNYQQEMVLAGNYTDFLLFIGFLLNYYDPDKAMWEYDLHAIVEDILQEMNQGSLLW